MTGAKSIGMMEKPQSVTRRGGRRDRRSGRVSTKPSFRSLNEWEAILRQEERGMGGAQAASVFL